MTTVTSILLCGIGGQGTVLASKLIARAAMNKGLSVMSAETIGMAQKGGSVFSHLKIGENIITPMIGHSEADVIIAFEPAEAVRMLPYLKKDGCMIVNTVPTMPVNSVLRGSVYNGSEMTAYLEKNVKRLITVDGERACAAAGSSKVLNVVLLGTAASGGFLGLSLGDLENALRQSVKPQLLEMNLRALHYCK